MNLKNSFNCCADKWENALLFLQVREIADRFYKQGELRWQIAALFALQEVYMFFQTCQGLH